jgi:hypothetical protein
MPYRRVYEAFEVRKLLQDAEGTASPVTNAPAHSRGLHATRTPGGTGVVKSDMYLRTHKQVGESNSQFNNRGGAVQTSAFANLIQQAEAATQALNSMKGQTGLGVLDEPAYAGIKVRLVLTIGGIKESSFIAGAVVPTMTTVHKSQAVVATLVNGASGVKVIIDRAPGAPNIFIQTCYPLPNAIDSYEAKNYDTNSLIAQG